MIILGILYLVSIFEICDALSQWERQLNASRCGRVPDSRSIRLQMKLRYYWSHLVGTETDQERLLLVYRIADELLKGHVPVSPELAEEMCALLAQVCQLLSTYQISMFQMHYGDAQTSTDADRFDQLMTRFYPTKLLDVACKRTLRYTNLL